MIPKFLQPERLPFASVEIVPAVVDVAIVPVPNQPLLGPVVEVELHPFGDVPPGQPASLPTIDPCGGSARQWWRGLGTRRRYRGNGR